MSYDRSLTAYLILAINVTNFRKELSPAKKHISAMSNIISNATNMSILLFRIMNMVIQRYDIKESGSALNHNFSGNHGEKDNHTKRSARNY